MIRATMVTPLSGPLGGYGRAGEHALRLWAERHQTGVVLDVIDANPDPALAMARAERGRPDLIFGPYGSGLVRSAATSTSRLVWNHGGASIGDLDNVVSVLAPAESYFVGAVQAIHQSDLGRPRFVVLHADTGFGRAVAAGAAEEAGRLGLPAVLAELPDEADTIDGEVVLVAGGFADERAIAPRLLAGQWRAVGLVGAGVDEVLAGLRAERDGLLGPAQWLASAAPIPDEGPSAAAFVAEYRSRVGAEPPYPAAQAFAAGLIASRCLREAGSTDDGALVAAARALDCTTMFGRFRLDPATGKQVGHQALTVQWQHGTRHVVWPTERAQVGLRYPRRRPGTAA